MSQIDKKAIINEFARKEGDTGSVEVQVAILTNKIAKLTEHLKENRQDKHALRGLKKMVGRREGLLKYLEREDIEACRALRAKLNLKQI